MCEPLVPAAQYLRMSTDHQQYSLDNQADTIARYAKQHNCQIVRTYSDAARSGLQIKNRPGLQQLLADVVTGGLIFKFILVYDVSRWGRFQDIDEAAHYEYLCKSSGVAVHYCAEVFSNDNDTAALILKAVKRTMAGEYSRELSFRVKAGLFRLASLGFKAGGSAVYGLRRQLVDSHGRVKQILPFGEQKNLATDRVTLVPGPENEVAVVRRIFSEFALRFRSPESIAIQLNRDEIPYLGGKAWKGHTIRRMLQDSHYAGFQVWGKTTASLLAPVKPMPLEHWAICPSAFEPIISRELYLAAEQRFAEFTCRLTDEQVLDRLRQVLKTRGGLNSSIIQKSRVCPGTGTYFKRFGGLLNVYARLGFNTPDVLRSRISTRQKILLVRHAFIKNLLDTFPEIEEVRKNRHFRALLRVQKTGRLVSVVLARHCKTQRGASWVLIAPKRERKKISLVALLNEGNTSIKTIRVFRRLPAGTFQIRIRPESGWFISGEPLENQADLLIVIRHLLTQRKVGPCCTTKRL